MLMDLSKLMQTAEAWITLGQSMYAGLLLVKKEDHFQHQLFAQLPLL